MQPPIKTLLMTADTLGGVWTYALQLTRALEPHAIVVSLAAMGGRLTPEQRAETARISNLRVFESSFKLEWMDDPWDDVQRAGDWLLSLENEIRPDLVHLNSFGHGMLPWKSPTVVAGHSCVLSWWKAVHGAPAPESWTRYRRHVAQCLRAADLVIAPSHTMLEALQSEYGLTCDAAVVYNGLNARRFAAGPKKNFVLAAGRIWDEGKNIAALDRIAARTPWPVYVAGETLHPDGERSARERELCGVIALGRLSARKLQHCYEAASIYALPARYEPFGLSALEAALSGCALLLGDIPSLREIWGGAAEFAPPNDDAAIEKKLRGLISDRSRREDLAARARTRGLTYTSERMAAGHMAAYERVAERAAVCAS